MPKFGECRFGEAKFNDKYTQKEITQRLYGTVPVGQWVRRTMNKKGAGESGAATFRVRPANGFYGSIAGVVYQDKYPYSAAMAAIDTGTPANKTRFAAGVAAWQALSDLEKAEWNRKATFGYNMSGYNLFLSVYIPTH